MKKMILFLVVSALALSRVNGEETEQQRIQRLEDAIHQLQQQNQTLQQRVQELEQKKAAPTTTATPAPAPSPGTQPAEKAETKPTSPFVIQWGKENKMVLGGYLQMNGEFGDVRAFEGRLPGGTSALNNRFLVRRTRINITGDFLEDFDFKVEGDFTSTDASPSGSNRLGFGATDLFVNWHAIPEANIKVGQWKAPFGLEQLTPDVSLYTPERSLVTDAITPERQVGVQLWGKPFANIWSEQKDLLTYYVGVFNGNGRNINFNDDNDFMVAGRIELMPYAGKLLGQDTKWKLGANAFHTRDAVGTVVSPAGNLAVQSEGSLKALTTTLKDERWAWGVDQSLTVGPFSLIAEFLEEKFRHPTATLGDFTANGYYIQGGYFLPFCDKKFQLVSEWASFNPGQKSNDDISSILGGLNYYIKGDNIKLMLNYIHTWSDFREHSPSLGRDEFDEAVLRLQLMF